ncbi:hypothetical protein OIY81_766 [Cryptosporidium canis]|uniref:Uncharacterized protein n=1 Tax=Cryptosporidium canis TaxID=195482 RepID=A0ABQ8P7P1_9CRYT|nr:hypothetical protein OJ252_1596 [Cryptosporidium canis]KAJ1613913.1 hypothetical protein OIY81_766 [Cryptosporidium canis]
MTILFLSTYSSSTTSEINPKKGYISSFIFPFLKIYKNSFLNAANVKYLKGTKPIFNAYCELNSRDIYFIIRLLRSVFIREQNISKKKWISNQLKRIEYLSSLRKSTNIYLQTNVFLNEKKTLKSLPPLQKANLIHVQNELISKKKKTCSSYEIPYLTHVDKAIPLTPRLHLIRDHLSMMNKNGINMIQGNIYHVVDPPQDSYSVPSVDISTALNNLCIKGENLIEDNSSFLRSVNSTAKKSSHFENCSFIKDHSTQVTAGTSTWNKMGSKKDETRPLYVNSYGPVQVKKEAMNVLPKSYISKAICFRAKNERNKWNESPEIRQENYNEQRLDKYRPKNIRLSGPFRYRIMGSRDHYNSCSQ